MIKLLYNKNKKKHSSTYIGKAIGKLISTFTYASYHIDFSGKFDVLECFALA